MPILKQPFHSIAAWALLLFLTISAAYAQKPQAKPQPKKPQPEAQSGDPNETYSVQTYEVGDLIISVQDHPYVDQLSRESLKASNGNGGSGGGGGFFSVPLGVGDQQRNHSSIAAKAAPIVLCQFGGGGGLGGGGGAAPATKETAHSNSSGVSMDDLIRVLINTVESNSWAVNGGQGNVEPLGTALVVNQTKSVHHMIDNLLDQLRRPGDNRRTLTIDARWLMLSSDDLDALMTKDPNGGGAADPKALAAFTRRSGSIRGLTNCFSGQLVYLTSGTNRNVVSGWVPVVGTLETGNSAASLVSTHSKAQIRFVAETSQPAPREGHVGYQPIMGTSNLGALLEIRPTMIGTTSMAVVELRSTLTAPAERTVAPSGNAATDALAPAVDRVAVETLQLATTLRMELGKPTVIGGMTYMPTSAKTHDDADKAERQQLYLVLEIH